MWPTIAKRVLDAKSVALAGAAGEELRARSGDAAGTLRERRPGNNR